MAWFNEVDNPKKMPVKKVVIRDKGLILETAMYSAYVFKSSKLHLQLMQALEVFAASGTGVVLEVFPDASEKYGFTVRPNPKGEMQEWFYNSTSGNYSNEFEDGSNPFLSTLTPPPNPLILDLSPPIEEEPAEQLSLKNGKKATSLHR